MKRNRDFIIAFFSLALSFLTITTLIWSGMWENENYTLRQMALNLFVLEVVFTLIYCQGLMMIRNHIHKKIRKEKRDDLLFYDFKRLMKGE